jgi:hypothetical protein
MAFGNITYVGNAKWQQVNNPAPVTVENQGVTIEVIYSGRADEKDRFLAKHQIGDRCSYIGATGETVGMDLMFLSRIEPDDSKEPFPQVRLIYAGFTNESGKETPDDQYSESTVSRSLTMTADFVPPIGWTLGRTVSGASRTISYETQEARVVSYGLSKQSAGSGGRAPSIEPFQKERSVTTVTYQIGGEERTMTTSGSIPAGVLAKLTPRVEIVRAGFSVEKVTGTKWWRATYSQSREYVAPDPT